MVKRTAKGGRKGARKGTPAPRALLLGELVEVRQREIGYRGSWHPAKVVKIDADRGLVEYESESGLENQKEYVPLSGDLEDGSRVVLRPRPPPVQVKSPETWQRGLCVDAFYGNAWWEGVLMEGVQVSDMLPVFFPDEGDRKSFCMSSLRVAQDWDNKTGKWKMKGLWTDFPSIEGRKFRLKRTFAVKPPKRSTLSQSGDHSPPLLLEGPSEEENKNSDKVEGTPKDKKRKRNEGSSKRVKKNSDEGIVQQEAITVEAETDDDETLCDWLQKHRRRKIMDCSELQTQTLDLPLTPVEDEAPIPVLDLAPSDVATIITNCLENGEPVADMNEDHLEIPTKQGSETSEPLNVLAMSDEVADDMLERTGCLPLKNKIDKLRFELNKSQVMNKEIVMVEEEPATPVQEESLPVTESVQKSKLLKSFSGSGVSSAKEKVKKVLLGSGWSICTGFRERFSRSLPEPLFISPEGRPYSSLASACREFLRRNKHAKRLRDSKVKLSQLQLIARGDYGSPSDLLATSSSEKNYRRAEENHRSRKCTKRKNNQGKQKGRSRTGVRLEAFSAPRAMQEDENEVHKRMTLFSWLLDMKVISENEKIQYLNRQTGTTFTGVITGEGILCSCCDEMYKISAYQDHTGGRISQMQLEDGRSILDCQVEALKAMEVKEAAIVVVDDEDVDENDDNCTFCGDAGRLVCCDHCPSTFHLQCIQLKNVPEGEWYCPRCCCASCKSSLYNPTQQMIVLFCDQCEREYHAQCTEDGGLLFKSGGKRFCSKKCLKVFEGLKRLIGRKTSLDGGCSWTILRSELHDPENLLDRETLAEHICRLALALGVIQECFRPMIDPRTKTDIVSQILFNRRGDDKRLDFRGFHTFLLEREDEVISVASIRVHGAHVAEMPFIGTRSHYRNQGMCKRLMGVIEQVLQALEVQTLVLPAIPEFINTWTGTFGFQKLTPTQGVQLMQLNIVTFPGSILLCKSLTWLQCGSRLPPPAEEQEWCDLLDEPEASITATTPTVMLEHNIDSERERKKSSPPCRRPLEESVSQQPKLLEPPSVMQTRSSKRSNKSSPSVASSLRRNARKNKQYVEVSTDDTGEAHNEPDEEEEYIPDEEEEVPEEDSVFPKAPTKTFSRRRFKQHGGTSRGIDTKASESNEDSRLCDIRERFEALLRKKWPKSKRSIRYR